MTYSIEIKPHLERTLKKLRKKDPVMYSRILKKIGEIIEEPHQYKPLSNVMAGVRRVHFDPYVLLFSINETAKKVEFLDFDHMIRYTDRQAGIAKEQVPLKSI